jgi:NAD(P)H-flavin reductase
LLIKKYDDGKFTSQFLSPHIDKTKIVISHPRGLGLSLDCVPATSIVLFAGGTGLYPFSDLIDLLFKAKLVRENHQMRDELLQRDPVLKSRPFERWNFQVYLAVNDLD